ncbi:hypothetical protein ABE142_21665 [Paenibacillus alvei]|uniref:hypothetical protein n=1 Tax=Paenibacillus alvei TaxID=44250 RepID=UPI0013DC4407|nr:hypothetical protein [Paenibacillus alvei]NEZ43950.1 hypothetical protein [Paenibacillus alvei]
MSVCTRCGKPINEHEFHQCSGENTAKQASPTADEFVQQVTAAAESDPFTTPQANHKTSGNTVPDWAKTIDKKNILQLLKNPASARSLTVSDWIYAVIAVLASALGFALFGYTLFGSIFASLMSSVSFLSSRSVTPPFSIFLQLFVYQLIVLAVLFISIWLISRWKGSKPLDFKTTLIQLAAMQMPFGLGYLLAFLLALLSFGSLAVAVAAFTWFVSVIVATTESMEQAEVIRPNRFPFITASMGMYFFLTYLVFKIVIL